MNYTQKTKTRLLIFGGAPVKPPRKLNNMLKFWNLF